MRIIPTNTPIPNPSPLEGEGLKRALEGLVIIAFTVLVCAVLIRPGGAAWLNGGVYDLFALLNTRPADQSIVLVTIDDASIAALGRWPWSRTRHTALIERLAAAHPKAIGLDILFSEPETPAIDEGFAAAIKNAGMVFLPRVSTPDGAGPIGLFAAAAAGQGDVEVTPDKDGVIRRARHCTPGDKASLMDVMARWVQPQTAPPINTCHDALIPFAAGPGRYPSIGYIHVLRGEIPPELFKDRVVLVGANATGMSDRFQTPIDRGVGMPGVELQAQVLDSLINGERREASGFGARLLFTGVFLGGFVFGLWRLGPVRAGALCLGLMLSALAVSEGLLRFGHLWLSPVGPVSAMLILFPLWNWRRLAGASAYLTRTITRLRVSLAGAAPPGSIRRPAPSTAADHFSRQVLDLADAIDQIESLRRFSDEILAALPDPTLVVAVDGLVIKANAAAQQNLALDGVLVGARAGDIIMGLGPRHPAEAATWSTQPGAETLQLELNDGRTLLIQTAPCGEDPGGAPLSVVRLADVTMLLATARQREQALQLLSHDMRSPLTSILAMIEHDAESRGRPDPGKKTFETRVEANARRALALADGFVQFARAEAAPLNRTLVDLGDVVSEAADQLWPQATRKSVALIQEGDEAPCLVWADASLISRAVCNLLDNAVKFSPAGGRVTISLAAEAPGRPGHRLMSVRDQGPGLSAAQIQSLFEPFQRFSNEEPGAGLGLAFVRSTILRHGGEVACDSRPGEGAVFMITLPAAEDGV